VPAIQILEHFDKVDHALPDLIASGVDPTTNALPLQLLEKLSATASSWQLSRRLMLCSKSSPSGNCASMATKPTKSA